MSQFNFVMDYGALQVSDINPSIGGKTTRDLTNPRVDDDLEAKEQMATGQIQPIKSPMYYLLPAVIILVVISFLQK